MTGEPENALWSAVLVMAIRDAKQRCPQAKSFIFEGGSWFRWVCDAAGVAPEWVRRKARGK